jgi:hypothetical protein
MIPPQQDNYNNNNNNYNSGYDDGYGGGGANDFRIGNMSMGKNSSDELSRRMNDLQQSYQITGQMNKPGEINFALDGSDTRGRGSIPQAPNGYSGAMGGGAMGGGAMGGGAMGGGAMGGGAMGGGNGNSNGNGNFQDFDAFSNMQNFGTNFNTGSNTSIDEIMGFGQNNNNNQVGGQNNNQMQMQQMMSQFMDMFQKMNNGYSGSGSGSGNSNGGVNKKSEADNFNENVDVKTRLNRLMNERSQTDSLVPPKNQSKFDPMKSPLENNNNFFFDVGLKIINDVTEKDLITMKSDELENLVKLYSQIISFNKLKRGNSNIAVKSNKKTSEVNNSMKILKFDSENHNNMSYLQIEFDEKIQNVTSIHILSTSFPKYTQNINENINTLSIKFDQEEEYTTLHLEDGNYTVKELIEKIQEGFASENINLKITMNINKHAVISINNRDSEDSFFSMKMYDDSILRLLGFTEDEYTGKISYISELRPNLNIFRYADIYISEMGKKIDSEPIGSLDLADDSNNKYPIIKDIGKEDLSGIDILITAHNNKNILHNFRDNYKIKFGINS